jgi:hypothetical protein
MSHDPTEALDVFRRGLVPLLSDGQLLALQRALETDDRRLTQGVTCEPYLYLPRTTEEQPVVAACLLGFCAWHARGWRATVGDLEVAFADLLKRVDVRMGRVAASQPLVLWYDDTPRAEMRAALLPEVTRALAEREGVASG